MGKGWISLVGLYSKEKWRAKAFTLRIVNWVVVEGFLFHLFLCSFSLLGTWWHDWWPLVGKFYNGVSHRSWVVSVFGPLIPPLSLSLPFDVIMCVCVWELEYSTWYRWGSTGISGANCRKVVCGSESVFRFSLSFLSLYLGLIICWLQIRKGLILLQVSFFEGCDLDYWNLDISGFWTLECFL